jgi:rsbT co-antagonist protein RsbR
MTEQQSKVAQLLRKHERDVLQQWLSYQISATTMRPDLVKESDLREQSRKFLQLFIDLVQHNGDDQNTEDWKSVKDLLADLSRTRAAQGFSPSETATFVFSLKQPMFDMLRSGLGDVEELVRQMWLTNALLDKLGLYTVEVYLQNRGSIISRQQQELMELSTPVVQLWDNVVALPLIGTLDSERTQAVMENLLEKVVETGASIAIIDITGVRTVDRLVAQHLLKTVAAARLMEPIASSAGFVRR